MFSMKAKYALKAVLHLGRKPGNTPTLIADLARDENIPKKFLEAILLELRNHGILQSRKGKGGGYTLIRPLHTLSVGQVVEIFDGPVVALVCVKQSTVLSCEACPQAPGCGLRLIMKRVQQAVTETLAGMKLSEVLDLTDQASAQNAGAFEI